MVMHGNGTGSNWPSNFLPSENLEDISDVVTEMVPLVITIYRTVEVEETGVIKSKRHLVGSYSTTHTASLILHSKDTYSDSYNTHQPL